jgi:hypothetical protein
VIKPSLSSGEVWLTVHQGEIRPQKRQISFGILEGETDAYNATRGEAMAAGSSPLTRLARFASLPPCAGPAAIIFFRLGFKWTIGTTERPR